MKFKPNITRFEMLKKGSEFIEGEIENVTDQYDRWRKADEYQEIVDWVCTLEELKKLVTKSMKAEERKSQNINSQAI